MGQTDFDIGHTDRPAAANESFKKHDEGPLLRALVRSNARAS
jgi:hypothetical protein